MLNRLWMKFKQWACNVGLCNLDKCKNHSVKTKLPENYWDNELPKVRPSVVPAPVLKRELSEDGRPVPYRSPQVAGHLAAKHGIANKNEEKTWCQCKYEGNKMCRCRKPV